LAIKVDSVDFDTELNTINPFANIDTSITYKDPYEDINFVKSKAVILDKDGGKIYENDVIFPDYFTENSINIVASKYFHKGKGREEHDLREMIDRVSNTITTWGETQNYFSSSQERNDFNYKLKRYQVQQIFAFNSPMYFNAGVSDKVQASACFILDVQDNMDSIAGVVAKESRIFKKGSGSGMNLSKIRSKYENVRDSKGYASGPVSFMKGHDTFAQIIRSGGALRRSAKLGILNIDHPDIEEFIDCKKYEEEKLNVLRKAGIKPRPGYELSDEVYFQNTNISVGIKDEFIKKVIEGKEWSTKYVTTGEIHKIYKARDLLYKIAKSAWECADPGLIFLDKLNEWNTCSNDGVIDSLNPCAEYVFLNNTACNLASLNLLKFFEFDKDKVVFNIDLFRDVVETVITAQDITVDAAVYPTEEITENSHKYRPVGLGYTNLGALLMCLGFPYDSDEGRLTASLITALMTGLAYHHSSVLAEKLGGFERFEVNKESFYRVLDKHAEYVNKLKFLDKINGLDNHVNTVWDEISTKINQNKPFRNAQVTLLMPCGTTSSLMGAQTTGVEPEFSHVKHKRLANTDGGSITYTSDIVRKSLEIFGYKEKDIEEVECFIKNNKPLVQCSCLDSKTRKIFDISNSCYPEQMISPEGHIKMIAAVQPFISGSVSKTINLPSDCNVEDVFKYYLESWRLGLKGITVYRDGSKSFQPLSTSKNEEIDEIEDIDDLTIGDIKGDDRLVKHIHAMLAERKLPNEVPSISHKFKINNVKGYITCGMHEDGDLAQLFINISKEGSTLSGLLDCLAIITSISLQRGVPLKDIVEKMIWQTFEPAGMTNNPQIRIATSIVDYIFKYIGMKYLEKEDQLELGLIKEEEQKYDDEFEVNEKKIESNIRRSLNNNFAGSGKICTRCGGVTIRKGMCDVCLNCGESGSCS
jgi:ribonucleoside-diphosphate reductase alpha chain